MGKFLKLAATALCTLGFVVCPRPDAFISGRAEVVSDFSERVALRNQSPVSAASAKAPLDFSIDSLPSPDSAVTETVSSPSSTYVPLLASAPPVATMGQAAPLTGVEAERFRRIIQYASSRSLHARSIGEIVQAIATQFWGSTYQANLLDRSSHETLFISLTRFDCVLFVETMLALAHSVAIQDYSDQQLAVNVQNQRYRDGKLDGYCSRLHYFSEWILDNQKRGRVVDIASHLGGISLNKSLNFMSNHRGDYPRLVNDDATYQCIRAMEASLSPSTIAYIPQKQVRQVYAHLQPGDVIAIATRLPGLDVTHTGLAYRNADGGIGLIHAVPETGVIISPDLQTYVNNAEGAIGILIARPTDPRLSASIR